MKETLLTMNMKEKADTLIHEVSTMKGNLRIQLLKAKVKVFSPGGFSYIGDWHNDNQHGYGVQKLKKDSRSEGGFLLKDTPEGYENSSYYNLFLLRGGDWIDNQPNGLIYEY